MSAQGEPVRRPRPRIEPARIEWRDGEPWSPLFEDVYFTKGCGVEESTYIFLEQNRLAQRFAEGGNFAILETGFGTGLNFLLTARLFETSAPDGMLHFVSVEKHPLAVDDLARALSQFSELAAERLIERYPPLVHGFHHIAFSTRVSLTLLFGDVSEMLPQIYSSADDRGKFQALFLDGFSPRTNQDMWSENVARELARLSARGTTLSSFTAAGHVRRSLEASGFRIKKQAGFGGKREMITGNFEGGGSRAPDGPPLREVIVIGAGIAGASLAWSLKRRGIACRILEKESEAAAGGSGNRRGVFQPVLAAEETPWSRWTLGGFVYLTSILKTLEFPASKEGVFQAAETEKEESRLRRAIEHLPESLARIVSQKEASALCGVGVSHPGVFFPTAGSLCPADLTAALIQASGAELSTHTNVSAVTIQPAGVELQTSKGNFSADAVAFCAGPGSAAFLAAPLQTTRGQVHHIPRKDFPDLRCVICSEGYLVPGEDVLIAGSTYSRTDESTEVHREGQEKIFASLRETIPELPEFSGLLPGRVGFRVSSKDRFCIFGRADERIFASTAHGSRGIVSAPLAAEVTASLIAGTPVPIAADLLAYFQDRYAVTLNPQSDGT